MEADVEFPSQGGEIEGIGIQGRVLRSRTALKVEMAASQCHP
jgi:hypothetical protein